MKPYRFLKHTADLGINVRGKDLKGLFINAASAMYELIADISCVKPIISVDIKAEGHDRDELLRNWLAELLYYFNVKNMLFSNFAIKELSDSAIGAVAKGEEIDRKRHALKHEIKAVTFHNLKISKKGSNLTTDIIFDI